MSPGRTPSRPNPEISTDSGPVTDDPRSSSRSAEILLVEVAKLQSDGEYFKRDLGETRGDMKDIRDRMTRLEVRVDHLPSKGFIVGGIVTMLAIISALLTIAPQLQRLVGTAPVQQQSPLPAKAPPQSN